MSEKTLHPPAPVRHHLTRAGAECSHFDSAEIAPRPIGKTPDELSPPLLKHEECSGYFLEPVRSILLQILI